MASGMCLHPFYTETNPEIILWLARRIAGDQWFCLFADDLGREPYRDCNEEVSR